MRDIGRWVHAVLSLSQSAPLVVLLARARQPDTGAHILGSPIRREILAAVLERPGLTLGELRSKVRLGWGNAYHHLAKLQRAGLVQMERYGRRLVVFPAAEPLDAMAAPALAILRGQTARAICDDIARHAPTDVSSIATRTGRSPRAVYYHVRQLIAVGLVESRSLVRQFSLYPSALHARILERGIDAEIFTSAPQEPPYNKKSP